MNYQKIYDSLIQNRQLNILDKFSKGEMHHIKMKSIYPDLEFEPSNLVKLTYREHFIAHKLLCKIYKGTPNYKSAAWAFWRMCYCNKDKLYHINKTSKSFESEKIEAVKIIGQSCKNKIRINNGIKMKMVSPEKIQSFLDNGYIIGGLKQNKESNLKRSLALKGRKHTLPSKLKGTKKSKETIEKMKISSRNRIRNYKTSDKTKKLLSLNAKGRIRINNGVYIKNVWPNELQHYLKNGFQVGGLKFKPSTREKMSKSHKGKPHNYVQTAWNKGLTKNTDIRVLKYSETRKINNIKAAEAALNMTTPKK